MVPVEFYSSIVYLSPDTGVKYTMLARARLITNLLGASIPLSVGAQPQVLIPEPLALADGVKFIAAGRGRPSGSVAGGPRAWIDGFVRPNCNGVAIVSGKPTRSKVLDNRDGSSSTPVAFDSAHGNHQRPRIRELIAGVLFTGRDPARFPPRA